MNTEPSQRPWRVDGIDISDANGEPVTPLYFNEQDEANAALIVDAVNGRAALSAVLRDMAKDYEAAWEGTPLRRALAKYFARLREIAGEGETPTGKGVGR